MRTLTTFLLSALLFGAAIQAQQASFTPYGAPCPATQPALAIQGLPRLGSAFTVGGIAFPGGCTRIFCPCACCNCNTCWGSVLFLGLGNPQIPLPGACNLLVTTDVPLFGDNMGNVTIQVPMLPALSGLRFYMQRLDLRLQEVTGTQCPTTYVPLGFAGSSNGIAAVIGL
jgi:hypothetical protein